MNSVPPSSTSKVPSIRIHNVDDVSVLFDNSDAFLADTLSLCNYSSSGDTTYICSQGLQAQFCDPVPFPNSPGDLEDMPEFSHLVSTGPYLTGPGYSIPHPTIERENGASTDARLSPGILGSPIPSPSSSSFTSSLSPASLHEPFAFSDFEPFSPSPATSDQQIIWPTPESNTDLSELPPSFMPPFPNDYLPSDFVDSQTGPHRPRTKSPRSSRPGPVASKAMLEANSRRRRHPAQFECPECDQTFTALFSLRRHAQSHTGERPFVCGIPGCNQRFYNSSDCKRHEKSKKRHKDL